MSEEETDEEVPIIVLDLDLEPFRSVQLRLKSAVTGYARISIGFRSRQVEPLCTSGTGRMGIVDRDCDESSVLETPFFYDTRLR